jgi:excisionase family DNA binding protein
VLTLKQAAERSGKSASTLRNQIKNGALRGFKLGREYVTTASALKEYEERLKQPRGFARLDHPLHGKQGPGHRRKHRPRSDQCEP